MNYHRFSARGIQPNLGSDMQPAALMRPADE